MRAHQVICDRCDDAESLIKDNTITAGWRLPEGWADFNTTDIAWNLCPPCTQRALERKPKSYEQAIKDAMIYGEGRVRAEYIPQQSPTPEGEKEGE